MQRFIYVWDEFDYYFVYENPKVLLNTNYPYLKNKIKYEKP